ncbi:unnamed protein product [Haemonchus placei]|uniref:MATH domain-containing protein n=1 Tax=Haemonchus placei TaxID=6290 RepID=A0A3P7VRH6_HAEPC|nr:unnamed protein product [Haemonchus placei]
MSESSAVNPSSTPATSSRATTTSPATEEQTLRVTIQHFSKMVDTLCSPCKRINGVPWRIMVMPKQHMVQKKNQKCMGFFLQCCPDNTYSDAWTCQSVAEMRLIAQKSGVQNFVRKTTHVYSAKENDWGYSCFMTWADVLDESQGYIKDDRVTLEITVKAEAPKNMMSREDFRRSIDQWYNLAEMQLARGQVDLSIEANQQALKFCKDKDKQSQEKLEAQRDRLVNHKLVESIHRIEKGPGDALRPTSLRQALTGAQKSATTSKATKVIKKERRGIVQQGKKTGNTLALKNRQNGTVDCSTERSTQQPEENGEENETRRVRISFKRDIFISQFFIFRTRIGTLEAEKLELEDRVKSLKKELDQVKKKAAEDRSKAKKEKQQLSQIASLIDRARSAEVAQVGMMLTAGVSVLEKTRDEAALNLAEAEDNLKRARTHSDMETMRRSVAEWKCVHEDCVSAISQARNEFEAACDAIRKGQRTLAQLTDLKIPSAPTLPKVVRLPPVQVVQPSTPACPSTTTSVSSVIQPPPAGVIGQPRTPQNNRYNSHGITYRGNCFWMIFKIICYSFTTRQCYQCQFIKFACSTVTIVVF